MRDEEPMHEASGGICRHCGGPVDKRGLSTGGLVVDELEEELEQPFEGEDIEEDETEQHESAERVRAAAFADAVRRRRP